MRSRRSGDTLTPVQWEGDGARAILQVKKEQILLLPVEPTKPARYFTLPDQGDLSVVPFPEVTGNLYFGGKGVFRLDLETGEGKGRKLKEGMEIVLVGGNGGVLYAREMAEPEEESAEEDSESGGYEFGELDPDALTFQPLFELGVDLLKARGAEIFFPGLMAVEPDGSRIAMPAKGEDRDLILLCTRAGFQTAVTPEFPAGQYRLGNLQWSPDGKTIYAAVLTPTEEEDVTQYSVGEIPIGGGPARLLPVTLIQADFPDEDNDPILSLQIALSPDGTTIATTTGHLDEKFIDREDRALYLVDVQDPERTVTKVPLLPPQKAGASDEEE